MADEENPFGEGPFGQGPFGPLVPTVAVAAAAAVLVPITIGAIFTKTLYYQANVVPPPTAALQTIAAAATPDKWLQRWQGPPKYQPNKGPFAAYLPAEPPEIVDTINAVAGVTSSQIFSRSLYYQSTTRGYVVGEADNTVTIDKWLVPLSRAAPRPPVYSAIYTPFVPKEATLENTQTPDKWLRGFLPAVPHAWPTKQVMPFVPREAVLDNTVTPDKWMQPWRGPSAYHPAPQGGAPFVPREAVLDNTVTPDAWMPRWQGPPSYHPAPAGGSPFVPKEATAENTVTPDKWLRPFVKAVPAPQARPTQPFYGYPYEAAVVDNTVTIDKWLQPLGTVPPRYLQPIVGRFTYPPAGPTVATLTTTLDWLRPWQGPPRYLLALPGGSPFIPKEAVLENTVTPDKWLVRFAKAVPVPKPVPTQPVLGYPYESQAIVVPYEQWWHQPLSRAAALTKRPVHNRQFQPFIPKEATLENTVTPDKWHRDLSRAVAKRPVTPTQPAFVYSPPVVVTLTTTLEWQPPLSRAPAAPKARPTQPVYAAVAPPAAVAAEAGYASVTSGVLYRKTLFYQARVQPYYPYEQVAPVCIPAFQVEGGFQFDAFQTCAEDQEPPPTVQEFIAAEVAGSALFGRSLFYQSLVSSTYGYLFISEVEGGPADEPERIVCVLRHSRVAVVPEVLRTATVLVDLRVATVPEESRTVEVLFTDRDEESNTFQTLPCSDPAMGDAFQDDGFQDDGFQ